MHSAGALQVAEAGDEPVPTGCRSGGGHPDAILPRAVAGGVTGVIGGRVLVAVSGDRGSPQ